MGRMSRVPRQNPQHDPDHIDGALSHTEKSRVASYKHLSGCRTHSHESMVLTAVGTLLLFGPAAWNDRCYHKLTTFLRYARIFKFENREFQLPRARASHDEMDM